MVQFWWEQLDMRDRNCNAILNSDAVFERLRAAKFQVVIADATVFCGEIIAAKLGVPLVYAARILPAEMQFQLSQVQQIQTLIRYGKNPLNNICSD